MSVLECAIENRAVALPTPIGGVVTGTLVGFTSEGRIPLITYQGQPGTAAMPARTVVDLPGSSIGGQVVLMFDRNDLSRPIVMGVLRSSDAADTAPPSVHVEADGRRLVLAVSEQLVLRCGRASITLTSAGKILIDGAYISSRSSGVVRIKGGSIQLN